jgi:hypothetical protein
MLHKKDILYSEIVGCIVVSIALDLSRGSHRINA